MKLIAFIESLTRYAGHLAAILILPLVAALVYEVFSRYVLGSPTLWAFETSYMVMGAIFMLGMANALRVGQHVSVDVITLKLSPRVNAAIRTLCYLFFLPLMIWLTWEVFKYFHDAWESGERSGRSAWNPIVWPVYLVWCVGFSLMCLQLLAEFLKSICTLIKGDGQTEHREELV
ncbi:TRAP transporter small permease subunit [Marinobacter bohaiensis]|uniref:TRAP transporter small permease subunit n=1 Tax=Marinobacter bohaiensis TaxID=2201898 RepID=UPI000DAC8FA4|nr:TRAP transporter small permease subunit [Marinobacter bohaiensis]